MPFTNKHNLPQGIYEALCHDTYDGVKDDPKNISVSGLLNPPLVRQLWQRHANEVQQDAIDMVWSVLGRAVHEVLDGISGEGRIKEERFEIEIDGMKLTGKPDIFNISSGIIEDYKITSAWSLVFAGEEGKTEWEQQLNCYAYLLRKKGYQVNGLRIIAILRDWTQYQANQDEGYPQSPVMVIQMRDWGEAEEERYIKERTALHSLANAQGIAEISPCTSKERWETPTKYAVKRKDQKKAVKLFDDKAQAEAFLTYSKDSALFIEERAGVSKRCLNYCPVAKFCPLGSQLMAG